MWRILLSNKQGHCGVGILLYYGIRHWTWLNHFNTSFFLSCYSYSVIIAIVHGFFSKNNIDELPFFLYVTMVFGLNNLIAVDKWLIGKA